MKDAFLIRNRYTASQLGRIFFITKIGVGRL